MEQILQIIKTLNIDNISQNSKEIKPGYIFVCFKNINDVLYAKEAIKNGASLIITNSERLQSDIAFLEIPNIFFINTDQIKEVAYDLCDMIYDQVPNYVYAVTGTNGKTSTVSYISQLLSFHNIDSITIGTIGVHASKELISYDFSFNLTMPDYFTIKKIMHIAKKSSIDHVALEASSIGLHQQRLGRIKVNRAIFTNFTQDHLDYHKTMEEYFRCKLLLFKNHLKEDAIAIVHDSLEISTEYSVKKLQYSYKNIDYNFDGILSSYQKDNLTAAIITLDFLQITQDDVNKITAPKGRLEKIYNNVYIDYAHTEDALKKAINALKSSINHKKFILVFGCGGDRDASKRASMGFVATENCDCVIITNDNPRTEDPNKIFNDILSGIVKNNYLIIENRADAIQHAITNSSKDDIILIAGKGHEEYQIFGRDKIYFSDKEEVLRHKSLIFL
jgi:UDP-N-acetylmuramyl tripeptide synthase